MKKADTRTMTIDFRGAGALPPLPRQLSILSALEGRDAERAAQIPLFSDGEPALQTARRTATSPAEKKGSHE